MTLSNLKVLSTLTTEVAKVMSSLHQIEPHGEIQFLTGLKIAHLALKHRQSKNHKTRIVLFIGSPVDDDDRDLTRLAKKLKKEKVSVDIVNFGETDDNTEKLTGFIDTLNGKDGTGSHMVTISVGPNISDALMKSPILAGEDMPLNTGGGFDFIDPNTDPELALALRVSLEEQRQRQEEENKGRPETVEEDTPMLNVPDPNTVDISQLSEEEQIALAMQMSLAGCEDDVVKTTAEATTNPAPTQTSSGTVPTTNQATVATSSTSNVTSDLDDVMADPEFLKQVLTDLPGVDPTSEAVKSVMGNIQKGSKNKKDDDDGEEESAAKKPRKDDTN